MKSNNSFRKLRLGIMTKRINELENDLIQPYCFLYTVKCRLLADYYKAIDNRSYRIKAYKTV